MTNEHEKQWQDKVNFETTKLFISESSNLYGFEQGIQFVRNNISKLPEVRELINRIKILKGYLKETYTEDWEPEFQAARDLEQLINKLEGGK